eukprot:5306497-Prymnesium_polylepis.2
MTVVRRTPVFGGRVDQIIICRGRNSPSVCQHDLYGRCAKGDGASKVEVGSFRSGAGCCYHIDPA